MENQLYVCYARISKEQGAKAQHRYGRELLKQALKTVYQLEITEQEIVCAQGGKPMLTSGWPWFNISHCRGLVACAVSPCPVGLDVESSRRVTPALVRRACCQKEMQYVENGLKIPQEEGKQLFSSDGRQALLEEQNDGRRAALEEKRDGNQAVMDARSDHKQALTQEQAQRFVRLWTLKESYLKMTGTGIRSALNQVQFAIEEEKHEKVCAQPLQEHGGRCVQALAEEDCVGRCEQALIEEDCGGRCGQALVAQDRGGRCEWILPSQIWSNQSGVFGQIKLKEDYILSVCTIEKMREPILQEVFL